MSNLLFAALAATLVGCNTVHPPKGAEAPVETAGKPGAAKVWVKQADESNWSQLPGWHEDNLAEAWPALLASCKVLQKNADWRAPCAAANALHKPDSAAVRNFLEASLTPWRLYSSAGADSNDRGLITGYYEPLLRGSRTRRPPFTTPLYAPPDDLLTIDLGDLYPELKGQRVRGRVQGRKVVPYAARAEIEASNALQGKELVWVDDATEAFFLQIQGSGRVQIFDAKSAQHPVETIRLAYADQNGHPYKSIGRWLVDRGELSLDQASAQGIKTWVLNHPQHQAELFDANPSYVFFREEKLADANSGPTGSLGVPLTPGRSLAVDPKFVPLGTPVFLATTQPNSSEPLRRLMLAQDTGGAISPLKGSAVRGDVFWGFGNAAAESAGKMKQQGQMWLLLPRGVLPQ